MGVTHFGRPGGYKNYKWEKRINKIHSSNRKKDSNFIERIDVEIKEEKDIEMKFTLNKMALILTIVFAILKLTGVIGWSWWLVFTPLLIVLALTALLWMIIGLCLVIVLKFGDDAQLKKYAEALADLKKKHNK